MQIAHISAFVFFLSITVVYKKNIVSLTKKQLSFCICMYCFEMGGGLGEE